MTDTWDVVVVGSCMIDLVSYAPRLPKSGETLRGTNFMSGFGGKGCNQCVAAKKLGANCLLVARIGNDSFGKNYYDKLRQYKIPTKTVKTTEDVSTGMAQIIVADTGENQIVIVSGANDRVTERDVRDVYSEIAKCKILVCQLEIPEATTIEALRIKANTQVGKSIFNAAPAHENLNRLLFCLPDIFCVNETEAEIILGMEVTGVPKAKEAVQRLLAKGCNEVIITLGQEGCVYGTQGSADCISVPALPVNAVDTTGAGDAFVGALAFLLATNPELPMEQVLKKANTVAAVSVQRVGTQASFPVINELPTDFSVS